MNTPARPVVDRTIDTVVTLAAPAAKANVSQMCFEVCALRAERGVNRTLQLLAGDYSAVDRHDVRSLCRHAACDWPERVDKLLRQLAPALAQRGLVRALALTPVAWTRIA